MTIPKALARLSHAQTFGLKQWRMAHAIIFKPIYPWAGNVRQNDIAKEQTVFVSHALIEKKTDQVFSAFRVQHQVRGDLGGLNKYGQEGVADALAGLYHDLNKIHAFREGNGRSMRTLCTAIARNAGYDFDWRRLEPATKLAFDKASAQERTAANPEPLAPFFRQAILPFVPPPLSPVAKLGAYTKPQLIN